MRTLPANRYTWRLLVSRCSKSHTAPFCQTVSLIDRRVILRHLVTQFKIRRLNVAQVSLKNLRKSSVDPRALIPAAAWLVAACGPEVTLATFGSSSGSSNSAGNNFNGSRLYLLIEDFNRPQIGAASPPA